MSLPDPLKAKVAISAVFLANGMIVGCWALLVPAVIENLRIKESDMGLIIFCGGFSAIFALAISAKLIAVFGVRTVIVFAALALAPGLFLMLKATTLIAAAIIFLLLMAALACQDVAMNANAADLERHCGKAIMSTFHGFWSAGAMIGAFGGGVFIAAFGSSVFAIAAGIIALVSALAGYRYLEQKPQNPVEISTPVFYFPKSLLAWLFGLIAFTGFVSEGSVIDWSAQFFRTELSSGIQLSGMAFGGFSLSMMLSRFLGDRLREKIGDKKLFIYSVSVAAIGMGAVILAPTASTAALGFFLAGFGNANLVPIAFSAAAKIENLPKGVGIATATFCGYAGLLFAPASLGYIGEHFGFRLVFGSMAALLLAMLVLAPMVGRQTQRA